MTGYPPELTLTLIERTKHVVWQRDGNQWRSYSFFFIIIISDEKRRENYYVKKKKHHKLYSERLQLSITSWSNRCVNLLLISFYLWSHIAPTLSLLSFFTLFLLLLLLLCVYTFFHFLLFIINLYCSIIFRTRDIDIHIFRTFMKLNAKYKYV